jgi:hypothetical protein
LISGAQFTHIGFPIAEYSHSNAFKLSELRILGMWNSCPTANEDDFAITFLPEDRAGVIMAKKSFKNLDLIEDGEKPIFPVPSGLAPRRTLCY